MDPHDKDVVTLLEVLEDVRLLLISAMPAASVAKTKKPSWEDVFRKAPSRVKPPATTAQVSRGRSRLSGSYTKTLRALGLSSH